MIIFNVVNGLNWFFVNGLYLLHTERWQPIGDDIGGLRKRMNWRGIAATTMLIQQLSVERSVTRFSPFLLHFMWKTVINLLRTRAGARAQPHGILLITVHTKRTFHSLFAQCWNVLPASNWNLWNANRANAHHGQLPPRVQATCAVSHQQ